MVVFRLIQPTAAVIEEQVATARNLPIDGPGLLAMRHGLKTGVLANDYAHDHLRSLVGQGGDVFAAAKRAFERWAMFDLGWVGIANPQALIAPGQVVAVETHTLRLWSLNLCRITEVVDTDELFGFIYSTTAMHVEQGEERFLLEFNPATGDVWYDLEAVSRPRSYLARIGYPITRGYQHRFARDSHRQMTKAIVTETL